MVFFNIVVQDCSKLGFFFSLYGTSSGKVPESAKSFAKVILNNRLIQVFKL